MTPELGGVHMHMCPHKHVHALHEDMCTHMCTLTHTPEQDTPSSDFQAGGLDHSSRLCGTLLLSFCEGCGLGQTVPSPSFPATHLLV